MKKALAALALLLAAALYFQPWAAGSSATAITQPLAFSHETHLKEADVECDDCHKGVLTSPFATLPRVKACLLCHNEPTGEHEDEPKVREYAAEKRQIPWIRVNRLPGHVYFPHAEHARAEVECIECHGDMKIVTEPVTVSNIEHLDMAACMACHSAEKASNDCITCHR